MQTEIKISDILHLAADQYLAKDESEVNRLGKYHYSCIAVEHAIGWATDSWVENNKLYKRVFTGLEAMGCDIKSISLFKELEQQSSNGESYYCTPESQQARYFWLKWAALMAEEQGE